MAEGAAHICDNCGKAQINKTGHILAPVGWINLQVSNRRDEYTPPRHYCCIKCLREAEQQLVNDGAFF